jgi:hypothetical protein
MDGEKMETTMIQKTIKTKEVTKYVTDDEEWEGFEFFHEPAEDSLTIEETEDGYIARYLVHDESCDGRGVDSDDNAFLVNFHRDFWVTKDKIITERDLKNWYRQEFDDYEDDEGNPMDHLPQSDKYWIFPLSCLVHSGVWLSLNHSFACDSQGWDTSHVGAVLIAKEEWPEEEKAREYAEGMVKEWNQYLAGDIWGIVKETFDKDKNQTEMDSCWGFYGWDYAMEEVKGL